ncbi:MAG: EAL domain-containing protein [Hoeflea sp.]|uniref:EAL domain-containing protein n=1 Tax=Hoeflea sp. TaxID=1940281 RepID=UPI001D42171D|nr:EAL domain-containing protein [Hoeflea sp.]MBU4529510.1 EAL domain-containing protein [Alphaproteobacteria bacterium]MBU4546629.1 EAL domain-containing protein [Alphaproteobacteria bacterium]MBU4550897.1 EAL domain-containing protein [Alphaproteobacteria bacterium]MBV1723839.1 EAL domain-containing protein [Hoeflea sp.]MBV1763116.1 EAL domain-containing protein [Hoeflea sp.]
MDYPSRSFIEENDRWKQALEAAGLGVWDWNLKTQICVYSESWRRMLGYTRSDFAENADLFLLLVHPEDRERAIESGDRHLAGKSDSIETELRLRHKDGHWVWVLDRGAVIERDENGLPLRVIGVQTDITKQKEAERDLSLMYERFRLALSASEIGIWHYDVDRKRSFWDAKTCEIFGLESRPADISGETWHGFLHPDDKLHAERQHMQALCEHNEVRLRYRIMRKGGEIRHVETLAKSVPGQGYSGLLVGTIRDVTDEVRASRALQAEKERYEVTLDAISDAVISTSIEGVVNFANPSARAMLSVDKEDVIGTNIFHLFNRDAPIEHEIASDQGDRNNNSTLHINSGIYRCKNNPITSPSGDWWGNVYTFQNITEETLRHKQLAYAAHHDALSGLFNRVAFDEALENAISGAADKAFSVFYLDLDHFKAINDFAGHAAGDEALKLLAAGIAKLLPGNAFFARLGGDEFAILLPGSDREAARKIATNVIAAIRDIDVGCVVGGPRLGCSIGITMVSDPSTTASDALARADDACYAAKSAGRNRFSFFTEDRNSATSGFSAAREVVDLMSALEENRVILFAQEIRSLEQPHDRCGRVEILARLQDRDGRIVGPDAFIPAAERFGMASVLDRWIIRKAFADYGHLLEAFDLKIGFNLSAQTLADPGLWSFVTATAEEHRTPLPQIAFEITETAAVTCFETANGFVLNARQHGCMVSLDDFGSGLSSFDYLRRFPINCIKIDGAFVERIAESKVDRAIVASVVELARNLGFDVVAEKIKNQEILTHLTRLGVAYGQGFHLHRPEPLEDIVKRQLGSLSLLGPATINA